MLGICDSTDVDLHLKVVQGGCACTACCVCPSVDNVEETGEFSFDYFVCGCV